MQSTGIAADEDKDDGDICADSEGQVYARATKYKKYYAIMYAWYMPRDATWTEKIKKNAGHRHEWENVIVWLKSPKPNAKIVGVSLSAHGGYKYHKKYKLNFESKTHTYVKYSQPFDNVRNNQLLKGNDDDPGVRQPLVAWDSLSDEQKLVMDTPNAFGGTTSGVRNADFNRFLDMAYPDVIAES